VSSGKAGIKAEPAFLFEKSGMDPSASFTKYLHGRAAMFMDIVARKMSLFQGISKAGCLAPAFRLPQSNSASRF